MNDTIHRSASSSLRMEAEPQKEDRRFRPSLLFIRYGASQKQHITVKTQQRLRSWELQQLHR